jgi:hypothetical protein
MTCIGNGVILHTLKQTGNKQMNYEGFVVYCFNQGINPDIIRACRDAVMADDYVLHGNATDKIYAQASLGYSELTEIDSVERAVKEVKECIWMSVCDYDALGRNLEKLRTRQLIKKPHKNLTRRILKLYYLLNGQAD